MSTTDIYDLQSPSTNLNHFANLVNLAATDGKITDLEKGLLKRFARKLNITEHDYAKVISNPAKYPVEGISSREKRLEHLFDLFKIIYVDGVMDDAEAVLLKRYAIGLGFDETTAGEVLNKSMVLFSGAFSFETYLNFMDGKF